MSLIGWGFLGTAAPVAWGTWLSRVLADDAEAGGGLQVAVIQLAITAGASLGGLLFDALGWWSTFSLSALLLFGSSLASFAAWQQCPVLYGSGAPDRIRTCDLWNRNPTLYPAELRVHPLAAGPPKQSVKRFLA